MTLVRALAEGKEIPGCEEVRWTSTNHFAPDTWSARFAMTGGPGLDWWDASVPPVIVDLQVNDGKWRSLGIGIVDTVEADPLTRTVMVSGRDLGALMLETPVAEAFQNMTGTQIVQAIAGNHGLTPSLTATPGLAGRYFQVDHTKEGHRGARAQSEWDLLIQIAQGEGFDLYLAGRTLNFHPLPQLTDKPVVVRWQRGTVPVSNVMNLQLRRAMTVAKPVTVRVESFQARTGQAVKAEAKSSGIRGGGNVAGSVFTQAGAHPQVYVFNRPNLTKEQAQALANSLLADITRHERVIRWREPIGPGLTPRNVVRLEGTGTAFDQVYYVESVETVANFEGAMMDVQAKSHSAEVTFAGA